jgi:hypothetical protein
MPLFLHVGSGTTGKADTTAGFNTEAWRELRLDIDPAAAPDILGSSTRMDAVEDASVDAVFSSHNIEHLYPHEVSLALAEFHRVLTPDGFSIVTCPDLQSVAALVAEGRLAEPAYASPAGPISPLDMLYGFSDDLAQGKLFMAHKTGFTSATLEQALRGAGFASVVLLRRPWAFDLWSLATKSAAPAAALRVLIRDHFPPSRAMAEL